jgi:hypothetical protein
MPGIVVPVIVGRWITGIPVCVVVMVWAVVITVARVVTPSNPEMNIPGRRVPIVVGLPARTAMVPAAAIPAAITPARIIAGIVHVHRTIPIAGTVTGIPAIV